LRRPLRATQGEKQTLAAATPNPSFPAAPPSERVTSTTSAARRDGGGGRPPTPPPPPRRRRGVLDPGRGIVPLSVSSRWGRVTGGVSRRPLCFGRAAVASSTFPVARRRLRRHQGQICGRGGRRWVDVGRSGLIWHVSWRRGACDGHRRPLPLGEARHASAARAPVLRRMPPSPCGGLRGGGCSVLRAGGETRMKK
jgi:hypothetical protein